MKKTYIKFCALIRRNRIPLISFSIVVAVVFVLLWPSIFISVRPGQLGVLYSRFFGGTVLDRVYDEGIHIIQPWDVLYIYDVRIQEETVNTQVLTVDGLPVDVQVSMRYQLMRNRLPVLHQDIGPEYRKKIIIPIINSAVRQTITNYRPNELYSTARHELEDKMLIEAVESMERLPILIHSFVLKNITLPEVLREAIESKLVAEQKFLRYSFLLKEAKAEAKRRAIEGQGIQYYQKLVNKHMTEKFLKYEGIKATTKLATSDNAKIVVVGGGKNGLPLILNTDEGADVAKSLTSKPERTPMVAKPSVVKAKPEPEGNAVSPKTSRRPTEGVQGWQVPRADFTDFIRKLDKTLLAPASSRK